MPAWIWGLVGLSIGLAVAAFVYISRPTQPMPVSRTNDVRPARAEAVKPTPRAFTFYELLPSQEVVVPAPTPAPGGRAPAAPANDGTQYLVQVASYRNPQDAERQKATLALMGLEARVESVTIDGRETYYRVRLGPVEGLPAAQKMVAELETHGVQSLLVKVR